jgi:ABC-2 type transport system permease protein
MIATILSLVNVMRKELAQTLRDRRAVFLLVAAPIIQLVAFGYAVNLDVDHIPTVVCDEDDTPKSREITEAFFANKTFSRVDTVRSPDDAERELETGEAAAAFIVPQGFEIHFVRRSNPTIQVLLDGTDSTRAQVGAGAASQFFGLRGVGLGGVVMPRGGRLPGVTARVLYNQTLSSAVYMVPGVAASLLLNVTAIITAMGLAKEKETGTLEQVLVTPIRPSVLLAGKCLPFVMFGLIDVIAVLLIGSQLFDVPLKGSLLVVGLGSVLYLFSTLGMGILLATLGSSQQQAILGAFSFILPAVLLSGFASPIENMPTWLQPLTLLNPMRHFVEIMRGCLLKGATFADLARQLIWLAGLGSAILGVSVMRFRKRLS